MVQTGAYPYIHRPPPPPFLPLLTRTHTNTHTCTSIYIPYNHIHSNALTYTHKCSYLLRDNDPQAFHRDRGGDGPVLPQALPRGKSIASQVFNLEGFVLPSKRPRSLKGVLVHKNVFTNENPLGRSYNKRNFKKEDNDKVMAQKLISYLRLQAYTGRPCLGLVHMSRKINYISKIVVASQWYRDLAVGKSALWTNEVTQEWRFFTNR